jgi:nucleotide-binding universal stress UspA family protein
VKGEKMFKKILVCLDGSEIAEKIMPFAVDQAKAMKAELNLLRIVPIPGGLTLDIPGSPSLPLRSASAPEHLKKDEEMALSYLNKTAEAFKSPGVKVTLNTLIGSPGPNIINYAKENSIDLIAISSHGHSGFRSVLLGSTAEYVIRESKLPILMIRPG